MPMLLLSNAKPSLIRSSFKLKTRIARDFKLRQREAELEQQLEVRRIELLKQGRFDLVAARIEFLPAT
jgi:hypothetical protein